MHLSVEMWNLHMGTNKVPLMVNTSQLARRRWRTWTFFPPTKMSLNWQRGWCSILGGASPLQKFSRGSFPKRTCEAISTYLNRPSIRHVRFCKTWTTAQTPRSTWKWRPVLITCWLISNPWWPHLWIGRPGRRGAWLAEERKPRSAALDWVSSGSICHNYVVVKGKSRKGLINLI